MIIANDDVVPTPSTIHQMAVDWDLLKNAGYKLGFLGVRSDFGNFARAKTYGSLLLMTI